MSFWLLVVDISTTREESGELNDTTEMMSRAVTSQLGGFLVTPSPNDVTELAENALMQANIHYVWLTSYMNELVHI